MPGSKMSFTRKRRASTGWTLQRVRTTDISYGDIPGLEFIRHTTLGTGGERCDFCIRVKRNRRNIRKRS